MVTVTVPPADQVTDVSSVVSSITGAVSEFGRAVSGFYRPASNPVMDGVIMAQRQAALLPGVTMFPKGAKGARAALTHLVTGGSLGLLVDQKMNDGIAAGMSHTALVW